MTYKCIVKGYDSGLNQLLDAQIRRWDSRLHKLIVANPEKAKNDRICERAIRQQLKGVRIVNPIAIRYHFYVPNKKHDRSNTASAFVKSFEDALQHCKVIENDTYDLVLTPVYYFDVDRNDPRIEVEIIEYIKEKKVR